MNESLRQKKVASLIKETLSRFILDESIQDSTSGLITVSKVTMTPDLQIAYVYLTYLGQEMDKSILKIMESRKGYIRKYIASKTKLKYNPLLIFSLDPTREYEENIDKILGQLKIK